jgi:Domain of unknown function (DUF4118)
MTEQDQDPSTERLTMSAATVAPFRIAANGHARALAPRAGLSIVSRILSAAIATRRGGPPDDPRPRPSYGSACAAVAAGVAALATIDSNELELSMLSLSPLIAAQLGALRCGIGPGWLASVLVVAAVAWFLPPDGSFLVDDWERLIGWAVWAALINTVWPGGTWDRGSHIISRLYARRTGGSRPRRHWRQRLGTHLQPTKQQVDNAQGRLVIGDRKAGAFTL